MNKLSFTKIVKYLFPLSFTFLVLFFSCSPEIKLAKEFISFNDTINILLLNTDNVYKRNLKENSDSVPDPVKDSIAVSKSILLGKTIDKVIMNLLITNITDELKQHKIHIYSEVDSNIFKQKTHAYIFNLAQVEMDEYNNPFTASQEFDTLTYYKDFALNAVNLNLWFNVSKLNDSLNKSKMLYSTDYISDDVVGNFKKVILTNEIRYVYKRRNITVDDIYNMVSDFGSVNAEYIYDFFLNEYIHTNHTGNIKPLYYHYNRKTGKIYPAGYFRFIFM